MVQTLCSYVLKAREGPVMDWLVEAQGGLFGNLSQSLGKLGQGSWDSIHQQDSAKQLLAQLQHKPPQHRVGWLCLASVFEFFYKSHLLYNSRCFLHREIESLNAVVCVNPNQSIFLFEKVAIIPLLATLSFTEKNCQFSHRSKYHLKLIKKRERERDPEQFSHLAC